MKYLVQTKFVDDKGLYSQLVGTVSDALIFLTNNLETTEKEGVIEEICIKQIVD